MCTRSHSAALRLEACEGREAAVPRSQRERRLGWRPARGGSASVTARASLGRIGSKTDELASDREARCDRLRWRCVSGAEHERGVGAI